MVLRRKEIWSALLTILRQRGVAFKKAKYQTLRVRTIPKGIEKYRKLVVILDERKLEYYTYQLPEEKILKVVIRGIPEGVTDGELKEDLTPKDSTPLRLLTSPDEEKFSGLRFTL